MAIVKQVGYRRKVEPRDRMNAKNYENYLEKGRMKEMDPHSENSDESWKQEFELTAASWGKLTNQIAIEYVQSWGKEESERIGAARLQELGMEATREAFPGHQFVVQPHISEKGNYHNHILVCPVSSETGKRMECNYTERGQLTQATDKRCIELGLSVPDRRSSKAKEKLSKEAHMMLRKKGITPIQLQIMRVADVARTYSRSLDEFVQTLLSFGVVVEDRGKVLTFFHPDRSQGIRDRRLGENYTKEGLDAQFRRVRNDIEQRPGLFEDIARKAAEFDLRRGFVGDSGGFPFPPGGHQKFAKPDRAQERGSRNQGLEIHQDDNHFGSTRYLLRDIIESTRSASVVDYCRANKIGLIANQDGSYCLKGRAFILIRDTKWESTKEKNGARVGGGGGLLEFVANHKHVSHIEALSIITGNDRLLLLEQHIGKVGSSYQEFHVPKGKWAKEKDAVDLLKHLSQHLGKNSMWSRALSNYKNVRATTEGAIHFIFGEEGMGAVEYKRDSKGGWAKKTLGVLHSGFLKQSGSSAKVHVFTDPFDFMDATKGRGLMSFQKSANVLVLGDSSHGAVDCFLALNSHVREIDFIGMDPKALGPDRLTDFENRGIRIKFSLPGDGAKGKENGLGIEI